MEPVHPHEHNKHEHAVERKHPRLLAHEVPVVALYELDHSEQAAHPDQQPQSDGVCLPSHPRVGCMRRWIPEHALVKDTSGDDEAAKEKELDKEATHDEVFANLLHILVDCHHIPPPIEELASGMETWPGRDAYRMTGAAAKSRRRTQRPW
ncbi:hypothetical protein FZEAL_6772 [Fusarium zealandicum]|uniref:Uncharacterized protein n=1 Tax=Fusarium zealandicum TaxID=1053134 RepID=A0A8H4XJJ8_9HYPO|nr:hypothetical protein FZEAL_6772 [Fusarium zealandicum]